MAEPASQGAKEGGMASVRSGEDLPARIASAIVLMALALGVAWAGGFSFLALWLLAGVLVAWEWQRLIGGRREWICLGITALALVAASPSSLHGSALNALLVLTAGAAIAFFVADADRRFWAAAGVFYSGAVVVAPSLLRASPAYGFVAVIWLFAVVWGTDVAAYFGGRLLQGPKLWPRVSPGKTWSGAIVGALGAASCGLAAAVLLAPTPPRILPLFIVGLGVSVASQLGDLFESAMKRRAGVKDSSRLIPGHGGLMDRLDGFVFAAALSCFVAALRSEGTWIAPGLFAW